MKGRYTAVLLAALLAVMPAAAGAEEPETIYGESETESEAAETKAASRSADVAEAETEAEDGTKPRNPEAEGILAKDAVMGARTLYSKMKHYAETTDNERFSGCFEDGVDAATIQNELMAVEAADEATKDLTSHQDLCYFDPTEDKTQSPYYFGVGLTDYKVNDDGTVDWYSTLLRVAKYGDSWKAAAMPDDHLLTGKYPEGFAEAESGGRNAVDLYPYFALRFSDNAVFEGTFYSLVNMAWQNEDGSISLALWIANGKENDRWCDSIDLVLSDGDKNITSVNAPVQQAVKAGSSVLCTVNIPAENVKTGTDKWADLTVSSNLLYQ